MMDKEHRYILEKGSKKSHCPVCGKQRFVRYIDTETGQYLPKQYGRCDREANCGYFLNAYKNGYVKMIWEQEQGIKTDSEQYQPKVKKKPLKEPVFIPVEVFSRTCSGYEINVFIQNLLTRVSFPFDVQNMEQVISLYHLGTIQKGYRSGAITFPFIDVKNNVRAVQVKQFNQKNHTTGTDFLHSIIEKQHKRNKMPLPDWLVAYKKNETKVSCLFGEHLLNKYQHNPIALVEAPKTAIYGTLYFGFPEEPTNLLWLAVYNLSSLNLNKCQALKGRNVYLFPDLSKGGKAFELWSNKANEIQKRLRGTCFQVSDLLEQLAAEQDKEQGKDIADYLIIQDWQLFRKQDMKEKPKPIPNPIETPVCEESEKSEVLKTTFFSHSKNEKLTNVNIENSIKEQTNNWDKSIAELENYFAPLKLPTKPLKLNKWLTITDCSLFIESNIATVKGNNGKRIFLPYLNRLQELKQVLNQNSN
jgi:hypothetical protein